jgi:hypothetical protein
MMKLFGATFGKCSNKERDEIVKRAKENNKKIKKLERCPICNELMNLFIIDDQSFIGIVCPNHGYYHGWMVVFYE